MNETELARWLKDRLSSDRGKSDWRALVESSWERFLETKVSALLIPDRIEALVVAHLTKERMIELVHFTMRAEVKSAVETMRADRQKLGRWVPDEARRSIHDLVAKKGFVDPEWVRSVFREKAIEAILSDTLYNAIREFSTVIPRLIQTQVLGRLGKLGGIGGGIGSRVMEEVEKLLEPEIRRFLDKGTRRALDGAARFAVDHIDDPVSLDFRRNMVSFVLDQEVAFHARAMSDEVIAELDRIAALIASQIAEREESKLIAREVIARAVHRYGDRTLHDVFTELGVRERPPFDAFAEASWPILLRALESNVAETWFLSLAGEICALFAG
jgi:hypothetical protein